MNYLHSLMTAGSGRTKGFARQGWFHGSGLWRRGGLLAVLALVLAACAAPLSGNAVTIRAIRDDPRHYVGNQVVIEGEVTETMSLLLVRYFTVNDGTGSMKVVTDKVLPRKGQRMRVAGKVNDYFSFGSETTLVMVEDEGEAVGRPLTASQESLH